MSGRHCDDGNRSMWGQDLPVYRSDQSDMDGGVAALDRMDSQDRRHVLTVLYLQCSPGIDLDLLGLLAKHVLVDMSDKGMDNVDGGDMDAVGRDACFSSNTGAGGDDTPPTRTPLFVCYQGPGDGNKAGHVGCPVW